MLYRRLRLSLSINPNKVRKGSQNRELRSLSAYLFKAVARQFAGLWVSAAASVGALFVRHWRTAPPAPHHLLKKVDENFKIAFWQLLRQAEGRQQKRCLPCFCPVKPHEPPGGNNRIAAA